LILDCEKNLNNKILCNKNIKINIEKLLEHHIMHH